MRPIVLLPALLLACEPPPPVEGGGANAELAVTIILPVPNEVVALDDDCVLRTDVAWDVDGLELVEFQDAQNVDGQGHVHVIWAPPAYEATPDQTILLEQPGLTVGSSLAIAVDLHDNEHGELGVGDEIEIEIGPDAAGACP